MDTYAEQFRAAVAAELRAERAAKQTTVDALAKAADIAAGSLHRYLSGQRDIPVSVLATLSKALRVAPGVILDRAVLRIKSEEN